MKSGAVLHGAPRADCSAGAFIERSFMKSFVRKSFAIALLAAVAGGFNLIAVQAADAGGKATPPHVWAHVKSKSDAEAVKAGDSIAMVCAKCKNVAVTLVTQDTKTKEKLVPGTKHLCEGCKGTITVVGSKAHNMEVIKHICSNCGDDSAFCCATSKSAPATHGMEKK